jgi:hypothetical protein
LAALTTNTVPPQGLRYDTLLAAATGGGDDCEAGAGVNLIVKNASGSSINVILAVPQLIDGDLVVTSRTIPVAATTGQSMIPVGIVFRNPTTGRAAIT